MQNLDAQRSKNPVSPGAPRLAALVVLGVWAACALLFAGLSPGSPGRTAVALGTYWAAAAVALAAVYSAVAGSSAGRRSFWVLLGLGLALRFAGYLSFTLSGGPYLTATLYLISYGLLFAALVRLVGLVTRRVSRVSALDAGSVMLSVGTLVYFFALSPLVSAGTLRAGEEALGVLARPMFDAALLYLSLVVLSSSRRPAFAGLLCLGFLTFLAADAVFIRGLSVVPYEPGRWPEMVFALGLAFLGLAGIRTAWTTPAALSGEGPAPREAPEGQARINPWRVFSFWLGPLSPPVHFAIVLGWGALYPPLPGYVYAGAAALLLYLAVRVALVSFVSHQLAREQEEDARRVEQGRILSGLYDAVRQGVHEVSLTLSGALEADRRGERGEARALLERSLSAARETEMKVSTPYYELRAGLPEGAPAAEEFLRERLAKFGEYFGIKTHEDLRASLRSLSPAETAAVYRVAVEAFWNVAKHAEASHMHLESRQVGSVLIVRVRDDGRGFDPADHPPGRGLGYLRKRAREVGAELDVISAPGRGTVVQIRFENKREPKKGYRTGTGRGL